MADYLEPMTDGQLTLTVKSGGVLRDDATVTAVTIYNPKGVAVATNQAMPAVGNGTGQYILSISAAWSTDTGRGVEGEYVAVIQTVRAGTTRIRRIRYPVRWDDDA